MRFSWLLASLRLRKRSRGERRYLRRTQQHIRPRLEVLEDRTLLNAGTLDSTFGQNGQVLTNFVGSGDDYAYSVLINSSAGTVTEVGNAGAGSSIALVRYQLADGTRDTTFGTNGEVLTAGLGNGVGGVLQADGKIVAAASSGVARYNSDGALDSSFGTNGEVNFASLGLYSFSATSTAIQGDHILIAGYQYNFSGGNWDAAVTRLNSDGSLDTTFGVNGVAVGFHSLYFNIRIAVAPDGSFALVGPASDPATGQTRFAVARFTSDGQLDTGFNSTGKQVLALGTNSSAATAAFESDGQGGYKLVAGGSGNNANGVSGTALVRFNADGSLDSTFGTNGVVLTQDYNYVQGLAVQADGKIVTADIGNRLSRYNADGSLDVSFGLYFP